MITLTYAVSGVLLAITGYLFSIDALSAESLTVAWVMVFFFASAAASSAYLTVGECFPLETRALAIAFSMRWAPPSAASPVPGYLAL